MCGDSAGESSVDGGESSVDGGLTATLQRRIDRVKNTRTYPFGAAASLRVGLGVLLPQALNLVLRRLFL